MLPLFLLSFVSKDYIVAFKTLTDLQKKFSFEYSYSVASMYHTESLIPFLLQNSSDEDYMCGVIAERRELEC